MAAQIVMPRLGDTMVEGKVLKWLKQVGDEVKKGEPVVLISAEKVDYEVEASEAGILKAILAKEEETVPVGSVIGIIGQMDEEIQPTGVSMPELPSGEAGPSPFSHLEAEDRAIVQEKGHGRVRISPAARKLAAKMGVDYSGLLGSGPGGRIVRKDVERFKEDGKIAKETSVPPRTEERAGIGKGADGPLRKGPIWEFGHEYLMSNMRQVIAKRMKESSLTSPHIYFFAEVDMTRINDLREAVAGKYERENGVRISMNDLLIKLTSLAIRDYPLLNARLDHEKIIIPPEINICLAVALPDGLIVPSIKSADRKTLKEIALSRKDLVDRARNGTLKLSELESGTFTISSLSQNDIFFFTAILNPPQSGILTVSQTQDKPVVVNREIVIRPIAIYGLSVDHRIVDGAVAAAFLQTLKKNIENPYACLVD